VVMSGAKEDALSKAQKPLKPDDFPVNADGKEISKTAHPSRTRMIRPSLPNASTMTKLDVKKISGQPRWI
jgi:hypothetical protein